VGFPHPTIDVPGEWPAIRDEVASVHHRDSFAEELTALLSGDSAPAPGHVCATAWVLSPDGGHTILVRHRTLGWSTPGGHVETHEDTRTAGRRELEEETGLTRFDVRAVGDGPAFVHITDTTNPEPHRHWNVAWLYVCDMDAPLSVTEGARWFACDDLPDGPPDLANCLRVLRGMID
jgi:8-oxo-dGTP pyrophosphatase MutT (NUDIX family)